MRIGVLREIKRKEFRVALTPAGALELSSSGHRITVEIAAGKGSGKRLHAETASLARGA